MRSRFLFFVGLAVGYVLGARAGRERYEQIRDGVSRLWGSPRVRRARQDVESFARQQAPVVRARAEAAAKAAPGVISDGARATAETARTVADRTAAVAADVAERAATAAKGVSQTVARAAQDVAGRTATTANDVAGKAADAAKDVATRVTSTADDVKDRVTATASGVRERGEEVGAQFVARASTARDDALAEIDDEDDS
jgi:hypothetical protein